MTVAAPTPVPWLVGDRWVPGEGTDRADDRNPSDVREVLAELVPLTRAQVSDAVEAGVADGVLGTVVTGHDVLAEVVLDDDRLLALGPAIDPTTSMGPLVSDGQRERVLGHLERARAAGSTIVAGGGVPGDDRLAHGCFVEPTVVTGVDADSALWREEVFGPVVAVRAVDDLDEAIAAVNDSTDGLSSSCFTNDLRHAERFVHEVDTGQVAIDLPTTGWDVHQPFGGFKDSGSAFKEQGLEGLRFSTRVKTAAIRSEW